VINLVLPALAPCIEPFQYSWIICKLDASIRSVIATRALTNASLASLSQFFSAYTS